MEHIELFLIALFFLIFANFSGKIEKSVFSGPMIFSIVGLLFSPHLLSGVSLDLDNKAIQFVAEFTLMILLFTDASRINIKSLRKEHTLPMQMLGISLPLTIILGALTALLIFDFISIPTALILAVILAPTDAALGQAVVSYEKIPVRIRQTINVESGLNDGIALPFLILFISIATGAESDHGSDRIAHWFLFAGKQIGFGIIIGIVVGLFGGRFVSFCQNKGIASKTFTDLSAVVLAILSFSLAEIIHGNGYISAFIAGLTLGNTSKHICDGVFDFAETEGQLLTLLTFLFFGSIIIYPTLQSITVEMLVYAVLSLTLIRIIPVFIGLIRDKLNFETKLFLGWFGPRGVATILYSILILNNTDIPNKEFIFNTAMLTVVLSIFLHGASAMPWSVAYSKRINRQKNICVDEHINVTEMPVKIIKRFIHK